ncbi:DNA polymerase III subunit alpha [Liquorilactobacillus mali]|uniref:DNA polymerase III subunit alpha n=1 Tax=Liquorilactobacillus mali TaxID=1618 RepID=UPI0029559168|nr:DNA polymerase III subunit alpha [Liquorilactobacillus mali]MDV7756922.1 DNA polymerase III subunit alpha [Liquorilactobacillus mali]
MGGAALQVISSYSLLQSSIRLKDVIKSAKAKGYTALALTDINVMYGVLSFYDACRVEGIKPLIGMTLETSTDKKETLILIAKNENGYHNLIQISTQKQLLLAKNDAEFIIRENAALFEDIITIIPPEDSFFVNKLLNGESELASKYLKQSRNLLQENLYIGISTATSEALYDKVLQYANKMNIKTVAVESIKYLEKNDLFVCKVMNAIKQNKQLDSKDLQYANNLNGSAWLKPLNDIKQNYLEKNRFEAFENMISLTKRVDFAFSPKRVILPKFQTPQGINANIYLKQLCSRGMQARMRDQPQSIIEKYLQRMDKELNIIKKMGFADYFLIVWDVTNYAHEHGILVGPGRGSAAGSLVSYLLGITDVDPIKYNLLFERFLNEERAQMPDIDLDIPDNRRQEIIEYVNRKYGENHVAQIITFGTFGAKQALRDVARVMGFSQVESNNWSRVIPSQLGITLADAEKKSIQLRNLINENERNQLLFKTALLLEGLPRHYSVHAAGVILSDADLRKVVPLQMGNDDVLLTQYTKDDVERVGLLKIDFLGLRNLTILNSTLSGIKKNFGQTVDINKISLNDEETLRLFQRADTSGVFQFESSGIRNVLRNLYPTSFEDIAAVNALFRPGPMENITHFIARKHGKEKIVYPDNSLIPILKNTYGILVYQEQVMQVASIMGGFTLGQADILRRAMSKKKASVIEELKSKFVDGAVKLGYSQKNAERVYDYIERFANYGFNRSHAIAYSKIAFQLAYLKVHYAAPFFAAILNSVIGDRIKTRDFIVEAKQHQLQIETPNINRSNYYTFSGKKNLIIGLGNIKTLRRDFIKEIIEERKNTGRYSSFDDFIRRINHKFLKEEPLKALIYSGTFDSFSENRATLLGNLSKKMSNVELSGESSELLSLLAPKQEKYTELPLEEILAGEQKYLGIFLSAHPVEQFAEVAQLHNAKMIANVHENEKQQILCLVKKIKVIRTKTGQQMAFLTVEDQTGEIELTLFPGIFEKVDDDLKTNQVYLVSGKSEKRNQKIQIIVSTMVSAESLKTEMKGRLFLRLTENDSSSINKQLLKTLQLHAGKVPVVLYEEKKAVKWVLDEKYWVNRSPELEEQLIKLIGKNNVVFQNENK